MKVQLLALIDFLNVQFEDWNDIDYDFPTNVAINKDNSIDIPVQITREHFVEPFTIQMRVQNDLTIEIELGQDFVEATDKYFWIETAPKLFKK